MRQTICRAFVAISFAAACGSSAAAAKYNLRWVMIHEPSTSAEEAAADFAARIEKESKGEMSVEVLSRSAYQKKYGNGRPISPYSVMRRLTAGELEICQTYSFMAGQYSHDLWALGMPYLFRDYDHAENVFEGSLGKDLLASLGKNSPLRGLAFTYSGGFGIFATKDIEARRPKDFRHMRVKVAQGLPLAGPLVRELEIDPIIGPPEAYVPLAQAGVADGVETTFARLDDLKEDREAKFVTNSEHFLLTTMIVVNEAYFQTLPAKYRKLVQDTAFEVARKERSATIRLNAEARKRLEARGVKVLDLSAEEKAEFRKVFDSGVGLGDVVPKETIQRIRDVKAGSLTVQKIPESASDAR